VIVIAGGIEDEEALLEHVGTVFAELPETKTVETPSYIQQFPTDSK
jgi:hypothetical protein